MTIQVNLSAGDVAWAMTEGVARYNLNRAMGNANLRGAAPTWVEQLAHEVSGCLGEIAVGRWLDKFPFSLFSDRKDGDVGPFEVRTTAYSTGKLLLSGQDNPERKYVLVTLPHHYTAIIHGWMYGYEVQQPEHWNTSMRVPCYSIEQSHLKDPRSLLNE